MIKFCTLDAEQITEARVIPILPLSRAAGGKLNIARAFVISDELPAQPYVLGKMENNKLDVCFCRWNRGNINTRKNKFRLGRMIDYLTAHLAATSPNIRFANRHLDNSKKSIGLSTLPLLYFLPTPVLLTREEN